jgi:hypothetical protein
MADGNRQDTPIPTSFREKSAWISFFSFLVVFGIYFGNVLLVLLGHTSARGTQRLFFTLLVVLVAVEVLLHALVAARSPREALTPKDERERLIELKATRIAFFVLVGGALLAIATTHHGAGTWVLAHCVLFAVVVAELVRFGSQIVFYRRGA